MADDDFFDGGLVFLWLLRKFCRSFNGEGCTNRGAHEFVLQRIGSVLKNSRSVARSVMRDANSVLMACASATSSHALPAGIRLRAIGRGWENSINSRPRTPNNCPVASLAFELRNTASLAT